MQNETDLLHEMGADGLSPEMQQQMLDRFYTMLNDRVGIALGEKMTDDQLDAFEQARQEGGDEKAFEWLTQNVPEYPTIFNQEVQELKEEIKTVIAGLSAN